VQRNDRQNGGEIQGRAAGDRAADANPRPYNPDPVLDRAPERANDRECFACGGSRVLTLVGGGMDGQAAACWACSGPGGIAAYPPSGLFVVRLAIDGDYETELNGESRLFAVAKEKAKRLAHLFRLVSKRADIRRVPCEVKVYFANGVDPARFVAAFPVWTPKVQAVLRAA